jgi:tetratricopeptide (TPR) repeat protein
LKWIRRFIFDTSMESVASEGTARAFPDAPMLADLRRAAELTTTNGFLIGMSATFQLWFEKGGEFDPAPGAAWAGGSEAGKAHVRDQLARLERLTESGSARVAGAAGAASATVRLLLMGDFSRAEREARGSLARYPDGDGALEVVIACLVLQEKWGELASVAEERLRHKESTRLRMMLAKSFERRSLWKEARAQVERAAIAAPGDFFVLLAGVALALRDSAGPSDTEAVLKRMADMKAGPFDAADAELQAYFEFLHGIAYGLAGDLAEARRHFRRLLAAHPGNPDYRKAMEAVGP